MLLIGDQENTEAKTAINLRGEESVSAPPKYTLKVYTVRSKTRTYVPSNSLDPIDLVFSLRQSFINQWLKPLTRILVGLPYGKNPEDIDKIPNTAVPLMAATVDPPNPLMLSNLRLNVLKQWGAEEDPDLAGHIVFELIPLRQPGVLVSLLEDASFMLPRHEIASYYGTGQLRAKVKVLHEFLSDNGKRERATFRDYKYVVMQPAPWN
ncbi:hypothetical protein FZEAL_8369 [Fusarium zealandicum]|uniref:Uncharacterized protein n=1 Tax=Fusarium zealandicum TaxID=1053134 RepID=A0A8H4UEC2_9HYPO|nr:hypothetical protein FZEAL_8369 [Fusarium zealandicum]